MESSDITFSGGLVSHSVSQQGKESISQSSIVSAQNFIGFSLPAVELSRYIRQYVWKLDMVKPISIYVQARLLIRCRCAGHPAHFSTNSILQRGRVVKWAMRIGVKFALAHRDNAINEDVVCI